MGLLKNVGTCGGDEKFANICTPYSSEQNLPAGIPGNSPKDVSCRSIPIKLTHVSSFSLVNILTFLGNALLDINCTDLAHFLGAARSISGNAPVTPYI